MSNTPDSPHELMRLLDEAVPPNTASMGNASPDPLVEIAQHLASLPKTSLSAGAVTNIEAQLRQAAVTFGPPRFFNPTRTLLISVAVGIMAILVGIFVIFDEDDKLPAVETTATATTSPTSSHTPTATITLTQSLTATALATPTLTATPVGSLVIEGPIQAINGSAIVIYGITIQLDPANPLIPTLQVNDTLHIEGQIEVAGNSVIVIAITIVLVDVDIYISDDGQVFRDDASCNNPPPPWAPAHGWRARCEGAPAPGNGNNNDDD